ncbi:helix-turn-helix domain-containing protein [Exiguobacterium sp. S22-S28]|uniref:helix-turn-helix domain-containing protein n=1 Tax=Exiguobacterium sp. S22-S28 TaxID=3342768 RepID=UPI00372CF4B8
MKDASEIFRDRFEEEMKKSGLNKASIAETIGVSKSTISRYYDGSIGPHATSIAKLSLLFGCSSDYLLGLSEERNPQDRATTHLKGIHDATATLTEKSFRGDRLRELRAQRGWQQDETASKFGMTPATLSRFENGKRQPDPSTLVLLADAFDVSADFLLGRVERPEATPSRYDGHASKTNDRIHLSEQGHTTLVHEKRFQNERLRKWRLKKGMQQDELAMRVKTNTSTLSRIENGKKQPDPEMIILIAELFNVSTDYLLGLTDDPSASPGDRTNAMSEKQKRISDVFSQEVLDGLSPERLSNITTYVSEQYTLSQLDGKK